MKNFKIHKTILAAFLLTALAACADSGIGPLSSLDPGNDAQEIADGSEGSDADGSDPKISDPTTTQPESGFRVDQEALKFKNRYGVNDVNSKLTDNRGVGDSELYGTRNMRVVLHGVMYRGGGNNKYMSPPRSNTNPLPTVGLTNLCREDFSTGIYLYSENFSSAPKVTNCKNTSHQDQNLQYKQYAADGEKEKILALVFARIKGQLNGPIYAHCWNGWHSSGMISAIVLKQFCGWSDGDVDAYWVKNTDGNSSGFTTIRNKIKAFKPLSKFQITADEKAAICPNR